MTFRPARTSSPGDPTPPRKKPRVRDLRATGLKVAVVVAVLTALALATRQAFTITCPPDVACVTLADLEAGMPLPEAIEVVDRDGEILAEVAGPLRHGLAPDEIPPRLAAAFVAVEDRRFRDHGGVDVRGILRAAFRNLRAGEVEEGASTIPMQLVRTLWSEQLRDAGPWRRKMIEAVTAPRMIDVLGHDRVLALYLNGIYLGNGIYGVERAARHYFGKAAAHLDLSETATLVGMTRGPERYEPRKFPERARARRDVVLRILQVEGIATAEEVEEALARPLALGPAPELRRNRTYVSAAVMRELRQVAPELAGAPGLRVVTTIDPVVQAEGERAVRAQLDAIERNAYGRFAARDSTELLQGAAVALDPATGEVRAWVGGRSFDASQFDRVQQARRQVGSLVKPFVVASALEHGVGILAPVSADTVPIAGENGPWLPADHVEETVLPLREALVRSSNRAAAHLAMDIGLDAVRAVGRTVGIDSPIPMLPSSSIGAFDASLLEMTGAYAVFGNGGHVVEPHLIGRIERRDGTVLWSRALQSPALPSSPVLDPSTSYVVLDAMRDVVDRGTGYAVRGAGYWGPAAGKTGTTNDGRDAWFIGLTPDLVAGVWVGFDRPGEIVEDAGGGALAAPAWAGWMRGLERQGLGARGSWDPPMGVRRVRYDPETGRALARGCSPRSGASAQEAWVRALDVTTLDECRRGVLGWFERAWHTIAPPDVTPLEPTRIRRGGR